MIEYKFKQIGHNPTLKLSIIEDELEIGHYLLIPQAKDIYELHTHFDKKAFGRTTSIGKEALKEGFKTLSKMENLVTKVPINNPLARRLTLSVGMKYYGTLPNSYETQSGFIDQELFYISRKDILCQH